MKDAKQVNTETFTLQNPSEDFIPYACHYNEETIITKNGELVQTILISGISEKFTSNKSDLRELIRESVFKNINSNKFALWFHTIRKKTDLTPLDTFNNTYAKDLDLAWKKRNFWNNKYINELYISIIIRGSNFDKNSLKPAEFFSRKKLHKKQIDILEQNHKNLNIVVNNILKDLFDQGAKKLKILTDRKSARSEQLEFFKKLINLSEQRMNLPVKDLSQYLANSKIAFADNSFQAVENDKKFFGSILTIKDYQKFDQEQIDDLLKLPQEFIITEILTFTDSQEVLSSLETQKKALETSNDQWLYSKSGLKNTISNNKNKNTDFGLSQLSIMIVSDDLNSIEEQIAKSIQALQKLGIVVVREDLNMEDLFWSQLPGNFHYTTRKRPISSKRVNEFASLHNSPEGKLKNIWGNAVTLFRLKDATPLFFNFHIKNNGKTLFLNSKNHYGHALLNFLICQLTKYDPQIIFIDHNNDSKITLKALGAKYYNVINDENFGFNIFKNDSETNKLILKYFLSTHLNNGSKKVDLTDQINSFFKKEKQERNIKSLLNSIKDISPKIKDALNNKQIKKLLDNETDFFSYISDYSCINTNELIEQNNQEIYNIFIKTLLKKIQSHFDNSRPSILVIKQSDLFIQSEFFQNEFTDYITQLNESNTLVILAVDSSSNQTQNFLKKNKKFFDQFATKIIMPNKNNFSSEHNILHYEQDVINEICKLSTLHKEFFIESDNNKYYAEFNIDGIDYESTILSGKQEYIDIMEQAIKLKSDECSKWIKEYYISLIDKLQENKDNII